MDACYGFGQRGIARVRVAISWISSWRDHRYFRPRPPYLENINQEQEHQPSYPNTIAIAIRITGSDTDRELLLPDNALTLEQTLVERAYLLGVEDSVESV